LSRMWSYTNNTVAYPSRT